MERYITIDIETNVVKEKPSKEDELRVMSWKNQDGEKGLLTIYDLKNIQDKISEYPVIIGYNIKKYDIPILEKYGCIFRNKIIIDEYEIIKKHIGKFKELKNVFDFKLGTITRALKQEIVKDQDFDYNLLKGNDWIKNIKKIKEYALRDIDTEHELFEWLKKQLEPFKYGLSNVEISRFEYMTLSTPSYAYKVICKKAGLKEEYERTDGKHKGKFKGGYVAEPTREIIRGNILEIDFSSAYPHAYMQMNLFSNNCTCCTEDEKYKGAELFKLKGKYCSKRFGKVEQALKELYAERQELKRKGDARQFAIKLLINIMYGICGHPAFKSVYDLDRASDCTTFGQTCLKYARKELRSYGYETVYSDTDSIYIDMTDKDEEELKTRVDKILNTIKNNTVFPQDTFEMPIDKRLKLMYMPGKKKKNYLYVTEDDHVGIKGLKIIKDDRQRVTKKVFDTYIKPVIIKTGNVKFGAEEIRGWVDDEIQKDISQACIHKRVSYKPYKLETSIQSQIQKRYGGGKHKLVPNHKFGVGKGVKLCSLKEFVEKGFGPGDVNKTQTFKELQIFSDEPLMKITKNINVKQENNSLKQWIIAK